MTGIVDDVLSVTDEILGIRDEIGAVKRPVFILTRTWSGTKIGDGAPSDVAVQVLPTPNVKDLSLDYRVREGGAIQSGDMLIKNISRESYPTEDHVNCTTDAKNLERWYYIDGKLYEVINVTRKYVTWYVQIRKSSKQKLYLAEP